jgi:hypothetical protein
MTGTPVEKINKKLKDKHGFRVGAGQARAGEDPGQDPGGGNGGREEEGEGLVMSRGEPIQVRVRIPETLRCTQRIRGHRCDTEPVWRVVSGSGPEVLSCATHLNMQCARLVFPGTHLALYRLKGR